MTAIQHMLFLFYDYFLHVIYELNDPLYTCADLCFIELQTTLEVPLRSN